MPSPRARARLGVHVRRAGKDEVEGVHGFFGCKAADLEQARGAGAVLSWRQEGADVYACTLTAADALYAATGKIAVVATSDVDGVLRAQAGVPREMFLVHVRCSFHAVADAHAALTVVIVRMGNEMVAYVECRCQLTTSGGATLHRARLPP